MFLPSFKDLIYLQICIILSLFISIYIYISVNSYLNLFISIYLAVDSHLSTVCISIMTKSDTIINPNIEAEKDNIKSSPI